MLSCVEEQHSATDRKTVKTLSLCSPLSSTLASYLSEQDLFINNHRYAGARAEKAAFVMNPSLSLVGMRKKREREVVNEKKIKGKI